jgi:hypothetical protein
MTQKEKLVITASRLHKGRRILTCKRAFRLSKEIHLSVEAIGTICSNNGIKIALCQLGCFK